MSLSKAAAKHSVDLRHLRSLSAQIQTKRTAAHYTGHLQEICVSVQADSGQVEGLLQTYFPHLQLVFLMLLGTTLKRVQNYT